MPYNLNTIKRALVGGGQRSNMFEVQVTFPAGFQPKDFQNPVGGFDTTMTVLCKAASIPASAIGEIPIPYMGRKIKVPGDRTFETWDTTIMNDENFSIRHALEQWLEAVEPHQGSLVNPGAGSRRRVAGQDGSQAKGTGLVRAFTHQGDLSAAYRMEGLWPMTIAAMDMDWDTTDTIQEYQVTWNYDWWVHATEDGGQSDVNIFLDSDFEF